MKINAKLIFGATCASLVWASANAQFTVDFSQAGTPLGRAGTSSYTDAVTGLEASGYYRDGGAWLQGELFRRDEPNDHGFGICNEPESTANPESSCGGGDVNELDNRGYPEVMVLKLPAGYTWVSVQVSSMDDNESGPIPEKGLLWAWDGVTMGLPGAVGSTLITDITGSAAFIEGVIPIPAAYQDSPYLVFEPHDPGSAHDDNDFLVYQATINLIPPPPGGGEGCTPGYWKQPHHFDSWVGYTPDMPFGSVFEDAFPGMTLVQVLSQGGGGLNALGRHTVAALLNSASPDVSYDVADVIAAFNAVFPGTKAEYSGLKDEFAGFNEQGCPLN